MSKSLLLFFIVLVTWFRFAEAQHTTVSLKRITAENGLSDNRVTAILRDAQGFIWIGTKDGLNRYDGREFYIFKNNENDSASLCGNRITCLAYDADSVLWIGTASSGFCSYDFRTAKFATYNKSNTALTSNSVNAIAFDKARNKLWLALTSYGLQSFDLKARQIDQDTNSYTRATTMEVAVSGGDIFYSALGGSLRKLPAGNKTFANLKGANTINKIFFDGDKLWCGGWDNALHEFSEETQLLKSYIFDGKEKLNFSGDEILSIAKARDGVLWCGAKYSGIHVFDIGNRRFLNGIKFSEKITARVNSMFRDGQGRIWIGSEDGLYLYDPLQNQFEAERMPVPEGIPSCKVYGRTITKGGKDFVISACGLFYRNETKGPYSYKEIIYQDERQQLVSIYSDHSGRIFIGTHKTLFELDTITLNFNTIKSNKANRGRGFYSITGSRVNDITSLQFNGDSLIAACIYGYYIAFVDNERENIFCMVPEKFRSEDWNEVFIRKLFVDSRNNFWICGATKGISKMQIPDTVHFSSFNFSDTLIRKIKYQLKSWANVKSGNINAVNDVFDIAENKDGTYWLTTQGNGLVKFNPSSDTLPFVSWSGDYKSMHGLIKPDDDNVWMISSNGLLHYSIKDNRYKLYGKNNGMSETIGGYFFNVPRPEVNVGFDGGFFSFNPSAILKDKEKPEVSITRLWVMDMPGDSLLLSDLRLKHDRNFLKFYVSANVFSSNEQTTFMYFLEGIDKNWRSNQNNPLITYTNLPHGDFTLKIKAINSDGIESDTISLPVVIIPPFYRTPWFYLCVIVLLVGAACAFYRYRIMQILKLQEVRNKIARDLHDDIGSTLGSIHLYSQIANTKLNGENPEEVKSILNKIGSSSREIIDKTGDAVWAVKASNDSLKNLILRMESYAASLLGAAGIHFNLHYDPAIADTRLEMTERKNIFLIFKEAIHNIIKYAHCTEVTIAIVKRGDRIKITVADNGVGFASNGVNPYNGNGISNMKVRAEEVKGSFSILSEPGKGTAIEINV